MFELFIPYQDAGSQAIALSILVIIIWLILLFITLRRG